MYQTLYPLTFGQINTPRVSLTAINSPHSSFRQTWYEGRDDTSSESAYTESRALLKYKSVATVVWREGGIEGRVWMGRA